MNKDFIGVLDSGIGGLNLLKELVISFPNENFIYFGDNNNAPYGTRTNYDLLSLTVNNIEKLKSFNLKLIVLACNTLSVNVLSDLKDIFSNVNIIGIYPPIESQVIQGKKTLLLATDRTAENYLNLKNVDSVGLTWLVKKIERNPFDLSEIDVNQFLPKNLFDYDTIILGCTHFIYLKNEFLKILTTQKMVDGTKNTVLQVKKFIASSKSPEKTYRNKVLFFGENSLFNKIVWEKLVFNTIKK